VLELLEGSVGIEARMLARLKALARPARQRGIIALTLATLRREYHGDLALLARLRKRWQSAQLERQLERDRAWNAELRLLFVGLGSRACADYFSSPPAYAPQR
jgi:hypothetical protein